MNEKTTLNEDGDLPPTAPPTMAPVFEELFPLWRAGSVITVPG